MLLVAIVSRVRGFQRGLSSHAHRQPVERTLSTLLGALDSRSLRFYGSEHPVFGFSFIPAAAMAAGAAVPAFAHGTMPREFSSARSFSSSTIPAGSQPKRGYGPYITLTPEEQDLFRLLRQARKETELTTTLRVAGGWVRDKLLATREFAQQHEEKPGRLTSKYKGSVQASMGRQGVKTLSNDDCQPVDIDIALDDMLGREFADHLNAYLEEAGKDTISVGVVLKNPEKSKHLETATMKVGAFWIDFVNLRAEEYAEDSRIPDLMRIGTPEEDAFRRDLTINSLFYNVNNGQVEDWTGRGFDDLRRGVVATPLAPLTTLLDDPLRTLRSVRFAARLRFTMDDALVEAAKNDLVRKALAEKVSRERIGGEVDLMLRSPDPVGAMRLLINLKLVGTVFPLDKCLAKDALDSSVFRQGHDLLSTTHDHLADCKALPPVWCESEKSYTTHGVEEMTLLQDENARRLLWYAAFLKPLYDHAKHVPQHQKSKREFKRANRSIISKLLVDELKRPARDAEAVEKIMRGADDFTLLMNSGCDLSAMSVILSDIRVIDHFPDDEDNSKLECSMHGQKIYSAVEDDPVWQHAMEFRLLCAEALKKVGPLWRAALVLSLSEQLEHISQGDLEYAIEGDIVSTNSSALLTFATKYTVADSISSLQVDESQEESQMGEIERYDTFATALQKIGLIGTWGEKPLLDGAHMKMALPNIPVGPLFRDVMDEQERWMTVHPGASADILVRHMAKVFPDYL
jgi:tRNA nucleotidyltransferase/poly(A) polymerase